MADNNNARDHLANERTFLAWIRTGVATIVFGFAVGRFSIALQEFMQFEKKPATTPGLTAWLGMISIVAGVLLIVAGLYRYRQTRYKSTRTRSSPQARSSTWSRFCSRSSGSCWRGTWRGSKSRRDNANHMANQSEKELAGRAAAELVRRGERRRPRHRFDCVFRGGRAGRAREGWPEDHRHSDVDCHRRTGALGGHSRSRPSTNIQRSTSPSTAPTKSIRNFSLIKGGGGALLREKIIADRVQDDDRGRRRFQQTGLGARQIPVAGGNHPVRPRCSGEKNHSPRRELQTATKSRRHTLRHRRRPSTFSIVVSEKSRIRPALARTLSDMPGVVEHGLFIGIAKIAFVGKKIP